MTAPTREFSITAGAHRLAATTVLAEDHEPDVVHLHGLGRTADRHGVRYLLDGLAIHGTASLTFEFSGNGESTGTLDEATLRTRRGESLAAVAQLDPTRRPVLIGTSMGAHLAAELVPEVEPRALALFVPAAYPAGSEDDPVLTALPKPGPYPDSPAYAGLRDFTGDLLVVVAEQDQVVPADVALGYLSHARRARSVEVLRLDCDHFVHRWLPHQHSALAAVTSALHRTALQGTALPRTPPHRTAPRERGTT